MPAAGGKDYNSAGLAGWAEYMSAHFRRSQSSRTDCFAEQAESSTVDKPGGTWTARLANHQCGEERAAVAGSARGRGSVATGLGRTQVVVTGVRMGW